jgi:tetratricopeptide (TPR) repeat protein
MSPVSPRALSPADRYQSATALYSAGKFGEALRMLEPLLRSNPTVPKATRVTALNLAAICSLNMNRTVDAETYWRRAINEKPDYADAHNNLAIVLMQSNRLLEAEEICRRALAIRPDYPDAHNTLANILTNLNRLPQAEAACRQAVYLRPDYFQASQSLGNILFRMRRLPEAEAAFRRVVEIQPDYVEAYGNLGNVLKELKRLPEAEDAYRRALAIRPDLAEIHSNLANVLKESKRLAEAEAACRQALAIRPGLPDGHFNLGNVLVDLERLAEAELSFRQALLTRPNYAEACNNLGTVLAGLGRLPEAEVAYRQALAIQPRYAEAHCSLGDVLVRLERFPGAEAAYRQALAIRPDDAGAHAKLGNILCRLRRLPEAEAAYRQALAIRPDYTEGYINLGTVLYDLKCVPEAEAAYRHALTLRPKHADAELNLAGLLLAAGRFSEGWRLYEARYDKANAHRNAFSPNVSCPQWRGESLEGKSLLVWHEQGYGDMIQFGRYLSLLKAQGATHITLACPTELRRLFEAVEGIDAVVNNDRALVQYDHDFWTFLLSIPLHCGTTPESIPGATYLKYQPDIVEKWRPRLAALTGHRIGLVWKGGAMHRNDSNRSLPSLATLAPLWTVPGVNFISLQKGQGEDEAASPSPTQPLLHLGPEILDFADSAAIIHQLDLVVCVDTAIAHLAGSLGKPCWVLLPGVGTDWRWMHAGADSLWYPGSMRLFRQPASGDWSVIVEQLRQGFLQTFPTIRDS